MLELLEIPQYNANAFVAVNTVYKTDDLSIFKEIVGNRTINLQHVRRLVDSIKLYGMKCNPILVSDKLEVIDGQHRLAAAKECGTFIYFIILEGYSLKDVHTLNLNQKNWTKRDFMHGYANMGIAPYVELRTFTEENPEFSFHDCIALYLNKFHTTVCLAHKNKRADKENVFEEGTLYPGDLELANKLANKLRKIKQYYSGYNRTIFVGTMMILFKNPNFDFNEFLHKLSLQPTALVDCSNRSQYRALIEDIYNFKSRNKINLKY